MNALRIIWVGLLAGVLFIILDALINANPLAQRFYEAYRPIMRASINAPLGVVLDLLSGIVMAAIFALLLPALPVHWATRGLAFGLIAWVFRCAMTSASQIVMFQIPPGTIIYSLTGGLFEMIALALFYALLLKPR